MVHCTWTPPQVRFATKAEVAASGGTDYPALQDDWTGNIEIPTAENSFHFRSNWTSGNDGTASCKAGQKIEAVIKYLHWPEDPTLKPEAPAPWTPDPDKANLPGSPTFSPELEGNSGGRPAVNLKAANDKKITSSGLGALFAATWLALQ